MAGSRRNLDISDGLAAARIQALRRARGLGKNELAGRAGVTYRTVHDLEQGRRPRVQEKTLILIAQGLDVPLDELIPRRAPASGPSGAASRPAPRKTTRVRRPRTLAIGIALLVLTVSGTLGYRSVSHSTTILVEDTSVTGHFPLRLTQTWTRTFPTSVNFDTVAPWSADTWLVGLQSSDTHAGALVALDRATGRERWRVAPSPDRMTAVFGSEDLVGGSFLARVGTGADLEGDGTPEFVVVFHHGLYAPAVVLVVESDGTIRSRYAHYGHLTGVAAADIDGDGRDAVYLTGTSNVDAHEGATIVRLDATGVSGQVLEDAVLRSRVPTDGAAVRLVLRNYAPEYMNLLDATRLVAHTPRIVFGTDGRPLLTTIVGRSDRIEEPQQVLVHLDEALNVVRTACHDRFRAHMTAHWPRRYVDGTGPADTSWRGAWIARSVRYEHGRLVTVDAK